MAFLHMRKLTAEEQAEKDRARGANILTYCVVSFALGGILVMTFPQLADLASDCKSVAISVGD